MNLLVKIIQVLFFIFMALFLIGGLGIVLVQTIGLIGSDGSIVTGVNDWLSPWVFRCATLCAICAFVLNYRPKKRAKEEE